MARKIVVLCDIHNDLGEEVPATVTKPLVVEKRPLSIDLCDDCEAKEYRPFVDLILRIGVPETHAKDPELYPTDRPYKCLLPSCPASFKHSSTRRKHIRELHPEDADRLIPPTSERTPCPIPGCDEKPLGTRGLIQHVRQGHPDEYPEWYEKYKAGSEADRTGDGQLALDRS